MSECEYLCHIVVVSDYAHRVEQMSHKFHLDFKKSWITRIGPKLVPDVVTSIRQKSNAGTVKKLELLKWKERCPDKVQVAPIQLKKDEWLFGPATKLSTRSIVYPCLCS